MKLRELTWQDFPEPCYDPQERYGDFKGTILDILQDNRIPDKDKVWAATRKGILDDKTLRLFAVACARQVQHLMTDERSINAIDVAERYAHGKATDEELAAAFDAAWDAACDADSNDARDAAWAAAWDAAWAAARDAAWATWDAARKKQVQILIELIKNK